MQYVSWCVPQTCYALRVAELVKEASRGRNIGGLWLVCFQAGNSQKRENRDESSLQNAKSEGRRQTHGDTKNSFKNKAQGSFECAVEGGFGNPDTTCCESC